MVRFSDQPLTYQRPLSGDHFEKIRQLVVTRFEASEAFHKSRFEKFYRWEKLIHMVSKKKLYDWKANAFLPYAFSVSEQSAAMKFLSMFTTRPYVTVQPRRGGMSPTAPVWLEDIAKRREALLDWHLTGDLDMAELGIDVFRLTERYGKAIVCISPQWDMNLLKYRSKEELPTALGPMARLSWKMRENPEFRYSAFCLDNTDFLPEPGKRHINGDHAMRYCHRRYNLVLDELMEMEAANLIGPIVGGQSVSEIRSSNDQENNEYKLRRQFLQHQDDYSTHRDLFDRSVELIECFTRVPMELIDPARAEMEAADGRDPTHRLYIIANRQVVLQDIALPWDHGMKPFIAVDCIPDPYDFWGKGKIEPLEHLNYVGNEIQNMRIDNVKMAINGLIGVRGDKMPPGWKRRLVSQPWGVLEVLGASPAEVIQRIETGDVTASSYEEQQQLWTLMQEASAVNETLMGAPGPARTLGEHQLKAETASKRLQYELIGQAQQLLGFKRGLSRFLMSLDRQFLPLPTYIRVVDPQTPDDFMEIPLDASTLQDDDELFTYIPTGASEGINEQAKRADLALMLQALTPYLPIAIPAGFNVLEMIKMILKTFGHDPQRFFMAAPPMLGMGFPMGAPGQPGQGGPPGPGGLPGMGGPPGSPMGVGRMVGGGGAPQEGFRAA